MSNALLNYVLDLVRRLLPVWRSSSAPVATYVRELPVSLERMYENAIDGEHLPWLHEGSFADIHIVESGNWGWRAVAHLQPASLFTRMELELRLDRDKHRWITKTLSGLGKGTVICTHAIPLEERKIKVVVDFYVPKVPRFAKNMFAKQFLETYRQLYDEDLQMMLERQKQIDALERKTPQQTETLDLGSATEIKSKLPLIFEFKQRRFRLDRLHGQWIAFATTCPHMLGPLEKAPVDPHAETIECPWHGYRFEVRTGECAQHARLKLAKPPKIIKNPGDDHLIAVAE